MGPQAPDAFLKARREGPGPRKEAERRGPSPLVSAKAGQRRPWKRLQQVPEMAGTGKAVGRQLSKVLSRRGSADARAKVGPGRPLCPGREDWRPAGAPGDCVCLDTCESRDPGT